MTALWPVQSSRPRHHNEVRHCLVILTLDTIQRWSTTMTLLLFVINNDWLHPLNTESILPVPPCICLYWDWVIFCSYQHNIQHAHCPPFFPSPGCQLTLVASTHQVLMRWTLAHYKTNKHLSSSQPAAAVSIHQVRNWPAACLFRLSTKYAVNYFTIWSFTMVSLFNDKCRYISHM